jgi:glycosyltransferase involved in cell wall biosynthesis
MPERGPITARYLANLLRAYAADPIEGEEFVPLLEIGLPDPTGQLEGLRIAGRRLLPPTRPLRSAALTVDPFVTRGAAVAAGRGARPGAVYHVVGANLPLASNLPVVATLLDLAPWELPHVYQANPSSQFGERLRARLLRDARLIVGSKSVAVAAERKLHVPASRIHVVPLAASPAAAACRGHAGAMAGAVAAERKLLGLPERYLLLATRYDARADIPTLLDALGALASRPRPASLPAGVPWPPALLAAGTGLDDHAALARAATRRGAGEGLFHAPRLSEVRQATLMAGAWALVHPAVSDAAGAAAVDAIACGTPVVASGVGALPEVVGGAGLLVEPRDPERMARAVETIWTDGALRAKLAGAAVSRARGLPDWPEVARLTRAVYAAALG